MNQGSMFMKEASPSEELLVLLEMLNVTNQQVEC